MDAFDYRRDVMNRILDLTERLGGGDAVLSDILICLNNETLGEVVDYLDELAEENWS